MKEAKVIHINDGTSVELTNGNRHYAEELTWAGEMLTLYLNEGYDILSIIPDYTPSYAGEGGYNFYKTGFTAVLTREKDENSRDITIEDWQERNVPDGPYYYEDYESMFDYTDDDESFFTEDDEEYDD